MNTAMMESLVNKLEPYAFQAKVTVEDRIGHLGEGIEQDIVPMAALGLLIALFALAGFQNKIMNHLRDKYIKPEDRIKGRGDFP